MGDLLILVSSNKLPAINNGMSAKLNKKDVFTNKLLTNHPFDSCQHLYEVKVLNWNIESHPHLMHPEGDISSP
jgi:hypothetical protein